MRAEAWEILRRGFPEASRDQRVFQFLVLPSLASSQGWELYERKLGKDNVESIAVSAIWHMGSDAAKFDPVARLRYPQKLSPTVAWVAGRIQRAVALRVIEDLSGIAISPQPKMDGLYLDGTSYELTLGSGSDLSKFVWHEDGPTQWKPCGTGPTRQPANLKMRFGRLSLTTPQPDKTAPATLNC